MQKTAWCVSLCLWVLICRTPAVAQEQNPSGKFVNLGPQVDTTAIQGSAFVRDASGRDVVYTAVRGQPGHLLGYEVASGKMFLDTPLSNSDGAWNATVATDGSLYFPAGNGHLLRHKPGSNVVDDLGPALPGETVMWDVSAGADGEVFGATYPGCRVIRYRPGEGFSDVGRGPLVKDENYVRTVAYDSTSGKVFAGVGSHAHLIELDPNTGEKTELLADQVKGQEAVYTLKIIPNAQTGNRLLIWVTNLNHTLIYNLKTKQIERTLGDMNVKSAIQSPDGSTIWYCDGTQLCRIDLSKPNEPPTQLTRCIGALASRWLDDGSLCVLTRYGQLLRYDPATGKSQITQLKISPQPIQIQSIELGPDGKIWMGGFLAGGTTSYDPATGKSETFHGMSQIEHIGVLDDKMYFGVYPHGRLYEFDPAKPWGDDNPRKIATVAGQSRPVAVLGVPELNKVFIGMVPEYGFLGGHLLSYEPQKDSLTDHGEVVARQSIISLADANGTIVGGTSITGGFGINPTEKEAKLFGWDPKATKKTFEIIPLPGATAITCLTIGPDKNVWGIANGTLFVFDPAHQKVLSTHELLKLNYSAKNDQVWRDGFLLVHPSGKVYGTLDDKFFFIDPATMDMTMLRNKGAQLLAMDREGRLYFRDTINLWQYTPLPDSK